MKKYYFLLMALVPGLYACRNAVVDRPMPAIIEIVGVDSLPAGQLRQMLDADVHLYRWQNHHVLYGHFANLPQRREQWAKACPAATIRVYERPFYVFDRCHCADSSIVAEWSHTIMTAQLVDDPALQAEYMDYHARQRELFPEVALGFCRAEFQQLLVYRSGRQLMLVISIPEGKSLDELNPKTSADNPRVDEWNARMSRYQEGIDDAPPDATWVTFDANDPVEQPNVKP
jgi:hypothetical protein